MVGFFLLDVAGFLLLATTVLPLPSRETDELLVAKNFKDPNSSGVIILSAESAQVPIHPVPHKAIYIPHMTCGLESTRYFAKYMNVYM